MSKEAPTESFCVYIESNADRELLDQVSARLDSIKNESNEKLDDLRNRDIISWKGQDSHGNLISAEFNIQEIRHNKTTTCCMHIRKNFAEAAENESAVLYLSTDNKSSRTQSVYIGVNGSYSSWFVSACKALEDGISPQIIKDAAENAHDQATIYSKKNKDGLSELSYHHNSYNNFLEELSKMRYHAL